jgi:hypothetical protein
MSIFGLGRRAGEAPTTPEVRAAEQANAADARAQVSQHDLKVADRERRRAYDAGRADERTRHRRHGHPVLATVVLLLAIVGVLWLVLAWREGSFAGGGAVVDQKLVQSAAPGKAALRNAADRSGDGLQNAGKALERQGDKLKKAGE